MTHQQHQMIIQQKRSYVIITYSPRMSYLRYVHNLITLRSKTAITIRAIGALYLEKLPSKTTSSVKQYTLIFRILNCFIAILLDYIQLIRHM